MADNAPEHSMMIYGPRAVRREYTVKEYAAIERVDERTVWRWIADKKALMVRKTPGGGVRIVVSE